MLTRLRRMDKFQPPMKSRNQYLPVLLSLVFAIQGCYTVVTPPDTLPQTVTKVVTGPSYVSAMPHGGSYGGWDPYWAPAMYYSGYSQGYGSYYYNPYNYYDYHHDHYAPVYIVGEESEPVAGRGFNRDDGVGSSRDRELRNGGGSTSVAKPEPIEQRDYVPSAPAAVSAPATAAPVPIRDVLPPPNEGSRKRVRKADPVQSARPEPPKVKEETSSNTQDSSSKRKRTRK